MRRETLFPRAGVSAGRSRVRSHPGTPRPRETEFRRQGRAQTEFGHERQKERCLKFVLALLGEVQSALRRRDNPPGPTTSMKTFTTLASLLLTSISALASFDLSLGLAAHYELNGNAFDSSTNAANGTIFGTVTPVTDRFGNSNGALAFDKNGYISLPNTTLLNGATQAAITVWVKNRLLPGEDGFVLAAGDIRSGLDPFTVRFNGNEFSEAGFTDTLQGPFGPDRSVGFGGGSGIFVAQNTWFSVVSQFSSVGGQTTYHLYINGQLALQENYARSAQVSFDRPMPIEIGAHVGSFYPTEFRGDIDDLRIYDRPLTPEEIASISVPEPTVSVSLILAGGLLLTRRKRPAAL